MSSLAEKTQRLRGRYSGDRMVEAAYDICSEREHNDAAQICPECLAASFDRLLDEACRVQPLVQLIIRVHEMAEAEVSAPPHSVIWEIEAELRAALESLGRPRFESDGPPPGGVQVKEPDGE